MNVFPWSGKRQGFLLFLFLFKILLAVSSEIRQEKEIKGTNIGRGKVNIFIQRWHDYLHKNPEKSTKHC